MSDFVEVQLGRIFHDFRGAVTGLRDALLAENAAILKREEQTSISQRWYRTGATLNSLQDEVVSDGDSRHYNLFPTAVSKRGAPYPLFGEYGTGRRGAATGTPAPAGYRYGGSKGITARRYSRLAVAAARPQIDRLTREQARRFAANMTTN